MAQRVERRSAQRDRRQTPRQLPPAVAPPPLPRSSAPARPLATPPPAAAEPAPAAEPSEPPSLKTIGRIAARAAEREMMLRMLHRTRWNRKEAASILGISYKAMLYKIKEHRLDDPLTDLDLPESDSVPRR
jgi:DNA-binding NtrC family response regulator